MSDNNELQKRDDQLKKVMEDNARLANELNAARNQLKTALPPIPPPVYPDVALPQAPEVAHQQKGSGDTEQPRPDCEGMIHVPPDPEKSNVPPPPPGGKRVLIGIPMLAITYEFMESFLKLWTELQVSKPPYEVGYHFAYRKPVHMAEEYLVSVAKFNKCTHILLMDDDIYDVKRADIDKLIEADRDVIGGVMHASKFPHAMCVFRRYNPERKVIDMPVDTSIYRLYEVPCKCHKCDNPVSHWDAKHCIHCGETLNNIIQQADLIPFALILSR